MREFWLALKIGAISLDSILSSIGISVVLSLNHKFESKAIDLHSSATCNLHLVVGFRAYSFKIGCTGYIPWFIYVYICCRNASN